jgi:signal transduction histidine kinase
VKTGYTLKTSEKIFIYIHIIMLVLFLLICSHMMLFNIGQRVMLGLWCGVYLAAALVRHFWIAESKSNLLKWVFPYFEGVILLIIISIEITGTAMALVTLMTADIIIDYEYRYGIAFAALGYVLYMYKYIGAVPDLALSSTILIFIIGAVQTVLFNGFAFLAKKYSIQSGKLEKTTAELNAKMIALEQMAVLKERNRITGEIHNTIGHQLTTALIQVEAAQILVDKDSKEAIRRLGVVKEQLREGLKEIRNSINAINSQEEYKNLGQGINRLADQVKKHASVEIEVEMDEVEEIRISLKKVIYNIILESTTNAIRHGHCSKIKVKLIKEKNIIVIYSFNNGAVPTELKYGYGLSQIKENLKEAGGSLLIKINQDGWFGLVAKLPI